MQPFIYLTRINTSFTSPTRPSCCEHSSMCCNDLCSYLCLLHSCTLFSLKAFAFINDAHASSLTQRSPCVSFLLSTSDPRFFFLLSRRFANHLFCHSFSYIAHALIYRLCVVLSVSPTLSRAIVVLSLSQTSQPFSSVAISSAFRGEREI